MNPELLRNFWTQLSTGRIIMMTAVLGLIFWATWLLSGSGGLGAVASVADNAFFIIVVLWGTWLSARAVIGEIRERTWDSQRLSAIKPMQMVFGKLFGPTIYVWYGGALCVAVIALHAMQQGGLGAGLERIFYYGLVGTFAHAMTLLASLLGVQRRGRAPNIGTFLFQIIGIVSGLALMGSYAALLENNIETAVWYGLTMPVGQFFVISLAVFVFFAIFGNYRMMRRELQFRNGAIGWLSFLIFMMVYVAGFVTVPADIDAPVTTFQMRIYVAAFTAALLTYLSLLLDAKDAVTLRWVGNRISSGRVVEGLNQLPSWGWSLVFALGLGIVSIVLTPGGNLLPMEEFNLVISDERVFSDVRFPTEINARILLTGVLLFLLRDVGIFLAFNARARGSSGDLGAIITIVLLYWVLPLIVATFTLNPTALSAFYPVPTNPVWATLIMPLIEVAVVLFIARARLQSVRQPVRA